MILSVPIDESGIFGYNIENEKAQLFQVLKQIQNDKFLRTSENDPELNSE